MTTPAKLTAAAPNGDLTIAGVIGNFTGSATNGDLTASITPTPGSVISLDGQNKVSLALPANFAADTVTLTAGASGKVDSSAFPSLKSGGSVGMAGAGAKSITVKSETDNVILKSQ